jgi:DNA-directed RNA polymerase specialized sigma24 family protein
MSDATKRPIVEWCEKEWLQRLQQQAQRLTACPYSADDLVHTCLIPFHDHHRYPWQHPEPAHALRWCTQKLRALACDAHCHAERQPCLALETLPESVACVDIAPQVQVDIDGERFLASLPPCLRTALALRLAGYSWEQAAQQLGVKASTLRGYLPELGAKFVDFFGYDPSKRASESLIRAEGKTAPSGDRGGNTDEGNTRIGERLGDDTEHAGGGVNPPLLWGARSVAVCNRGYGGSN